MEKTNNTQSSTLMRAAMVLSLLSAIKGSAQHYDIYALKFGERTNRIPVTDIAVGSHSRDSVQVAYMYWLLKGHGKNILVDAGFTGDADIDRQEVRFSSPEKMLRGVGLQPEDISDIIITHPHWDHIGGIDLYPDATVWMQKKDYEYFVGAAWQKNGNSGGFDREDVRRIVNRNLQGRLRLVDGDSANIMPGITVYTGSRHTFESQYVLVGEGSSRLIIASDNAKFWYNLYENLPIPACLDTNAYRRSLARMIGLAGSVDRVIPGHDPLVFEKFPRVAEGIVRLTD